MNRSNQMATKQVPIVVGVIVNKEGKILLARRNHPEQPDAHGKWEIIGGKIEPDETPEQAVVREAKEESGLDVAIKRLLPKIYVNYWNNKDGDIHQTFIIAYECTVTGGELHSVNFDHRISELKFINLSEIDAYDTLPYAKEIAKMILL